MKKVLLYTNELDLRKSRDLAKRAETDINNFVSMISRDLKRNLTKDEKLLLLKDAPDFLEKTLDFTLPNAPEKLKYEALGVDIDEIKKLWSARNWERYEFTQDKKGYFELSEIQPMFENHRIYASPRQLEVLEQSQVLADALNVAVSQGLNSVRVPYKVKESFKVVRFDEIDNLFVPNLEYIAHGIKG